MSKQDLKLFGVHDVTFCHDLEGAWMSSVIFTFLYEVSIFTYDCAKNMRIILQLHTVYIHLNHLEKLLKNVFPFQYSLSDKVTFYLKLNQR